MAIETGPGLGRVVSHRRAAQDDEGTDAALGRSGDPRHDHLDRRDPRLRRPARIYFWGTWWCVPFFFVYGVLYGSSSDSRWHECGHGTAFRTRWMNDVDLPDRQLHADAQSGDLALEPCAPPHRHDHRRPRRRDRRDAPAGPAERGTCLHRASSISAIRCRRCSATPSAICRRDEKSFIPEMEQHKAVTAARWHVADLRRDDRARDLLRGPGCR